MDCPDLEKEDQGRHLASDRDQMFPHGHLAPWARCHCLAGLGTEEGEDIFSPDATCSHSFCKVLFLSDIEDF